MTLPELIAAARVALDDPNDGVDSRDLLWSDDELVRYANEAQNEAARRAYLLFDDETSVTRVAINSTGNRFPVDDRVFRIVDARIVGSIFPKLINANENRLDEIIPRWGTSTGEPRRWVNRGSQILLDKIPSQSGTLQLEAYILPTPMVLGANEVIDIPLVHHEGLVYWIKKMAYDKDDAEVNSPEKAAKASNAFTSRFGSRRSAANEQVLKRGQARRRRAQFF